MTREQWYKQRIAQFGLCFVKPWECDNHDSEQEPEMQPEPEPVIMD